MPAMNGKFLLGDAGVVGGVVGGLGHAGKGLAHSRLHQHIAPQVGVDVLKDVALQVLQWRHQHLATPQIACQPRIHPTG